MLNELAKEIHQNNIKKGFYDKEKNIGEMLCLIHSEVSEALEADRNGVHALGFDQAPSGETMSIIKIVNGYTEDEDFKNEYDGSIKGTFEEEMADIIIRVLDLCAYKCINIDQHVECKMRYNKLRPYKHGKRY